MPDEVSPERQLWIVGTLLFGSGLSALIYQTVWLRQFRLVFGASTAATAAVLAIFMAGLGAGGLWLGRRADLERRPLRFYARLELVVAVSAAVTPLLVYLAGVLYRLIGGTPAVGPFPGTIIRLILATLVLAVPTIAMGGTLPAAARAIERDRDLGRNRLAVIYASNTCGAVTGVMVSTFFLLETMGNRLTLWIACLLNLLVAMAALFADRGLFREIAPEERAPDPGVDGFPRHSHRAFVLAAAAIAGFVFLLMEIVWYRMLAPLLGGTSYTFGLILGVALLGIGAGGFAYSRRDESSPATFSGFAVVCALEAAAIALPFALGDRLALLALQLRALGIFGFEGFVAGWFVIVMIVVFPMAFVAGFQFPLLIGLLGHGRNGVGRDVGHALAWNTAGAIAGSLAGGFGLLPLLSATGVWRMAPVPLMILAVGALGLGGTAIKLSIPRTLTAMALVTVTLIGISATGPTAAWRHSPIGAGRSQLLEGNVNELTDWLHKRRRIIRWQADGVESSVAIAADDGIEFLINGKSDGNSRLDAGTQVMSGVIGPLLHGNVRRALVIGLGTGSTAGWLASVPTVERVDVVELEPTVVEVAKASVPVNHDALRNPKIHLYSGDGREVLLTSRDRYDLIISEPSNPYRSGVASLFTRDFYRAVTNRLATGGLFLQWMQVYEIDSETLQTVYATLRSVFPNVETWKTLQVDLLLVGSMEPVLYDATVLRQRMTTEPFRTALADVWKLRDLEGLLARRIGGTALATTLAGGATVNTDDLTVIEFAFARTLGTRSNLDESDLRAASRMIGSETPSLSRGSIDPERLADRRVGVRAIDGAPPSPEPGMTPILALRAEAISSWMRGDFEGAVRRWMTQTRPPDDEVELISITESFASLADERALAFIPRLTEFSAIEGEVAMSRYHFASSRPGQAAEALARAYVAYRTDPWPLRLVMARTFDLAQSIIAADKTTHSADLLFEAMSEPFSVSLFEEARLRSLMLIAQRIDHQQCGSASLRILAMVEPHVPWDESFLARRSLCYAQTSDPRATDARRDYARFLKHAPKPLSNAAR